MAKLKVYQSSVGTHYKIVAAPNQKAAAAALRMSLYEVRLYTSVTGNPETIAVAMSKPGTVFRRSNSVYDSQWEEA